MNDKAGIIVLIIAVASKEFGGGVSAKNPVNKASQ